MKKFDLPQDKNPSGISPRSALEEVLREGAKKMLQEAIETEVARICASLPGTARRNEQTSGYQKWLPSLKGHFNRHRFIECSTTESQGQERK